MTIQLPTVISSSTLLNGVVRGAQRAAERLGPDYRVVIAGDFTNSVRIYRIVDHSTDDVLTPNQSLPEADHPVWSMKLQKSSVLDRPKDLTGIFRSLPPRFFFLTEDEALEYIGSLERAVEKDVLAKLKQNEAKEMG